jgi:hemerythrin-like domain-containing protein
MTATRIADRIDVPQVRLPGQAAAPEGPVDMLMMYVLHHAFRRDLAAFADAVPRTPVEAIGTWQALADRWTRFGEILHLHHTGEDEGLWPLLLTRVDAAGDTGARATLEAMEAEHEQIDPLLRSCAEGLAAMAAGGSADQRAALAVRTAATREALTRHLAHEETDAIALVQKYLTDEDWVRLEKQNFHKPSPRELLFSVPWVCQGLPDDVLRRGFAMNGQGMRVLWLLTRRRFARQHLRAFGA